MRVMWRVVCDLPTPVRTAVTATTGFELSSMVARAEQRTKPAPAAVARPARSIT
jgi:hypothetical protein